MKENPLRAWREHKGLSACAVALRLDLTEQSVLSFERGRFSPSVTSFDKIATLMGEEPSKLRAIWRFWRKGQVECQS